MSHIEQIKTAFMICLLWSSMDDDTPMDENHDIYDFSPEAVATIDTLVNRFYADCWQLVKDCRNDWEHAGHDLWLTIAGHGAGFWDGDWPLNGDLLTQWCKSYQYKIDPYIGDDNKVYFMGNKN